MLNKLSILTLALISAAFLHSQELVHVTPTINPLGIIILFRLLFHML